MVLDLVFQISFFLDLLVFKTVLKYADDTCLIGLISNSSDLDCYLSEVNRISNYCTDLDLLFEAGKTKEMLFSTKQDKPSSLLVILF